MMALPLCLRGHEVRTTTLTRVRSALLMPPNIDMTSALTMNVHRVDIDCVFGVDGS